MVLKIIQKIQLKINPIKFWRKRGAIIGNGCEIYSSANFGSEPYLVKIGDNVRVNSGVQFITHDGGVWVLRNLFDELKDVDLIKPIQIGNNCHIGSNSVIMPGISIGNNVIVGVGAIVTKDVPDNSIVAGVPARIIETIDEYLEKHKRDFLKTKKMSISQKRQYLIEKVNHKKEEK